VTPVVAAAATAFALSAALTPVVRRLALACGATDVPDVRRVHVRPTARAGGLAIALAAAVALPLADAVPSAGVVAGALLLLSMGLLDDLLSLGVRAKLGVQVVAALCAVAGGVRFSLVGTPPEPIEAALTVVWIVFVTNALNLSDGLDGLAAGLGAIICLWLAAAALAAGHPANAAPALVLTGALLGFLPYNLNPASIFLGDAGSLVIGYAVAVLPLLALEGHITSPLAAVLLAALPVTDTVLTVSRRFLSRGLDVWGTRGFWRGILAGLRNIGQADRRHIHHRLVDLGLTQRQAVPILYGVAAVTGALGFLAARSAHTPVDLFALGFALATLGLVQALGIDELRLARSGVVLPVVRRLFDQHGLFVMLDVGLAAAAYAGALLLTGTAASRLEMIAAVTIVTGIALATFALHGIYRVAWRATGLVGLGLLLRACLVTAVGVYAALRIVALPVGGGVALVFLAFLLPAVATLRFSYLLLAQAAESAAAPERTVVCGTAAAARRALTRLRRQGLGDLHPIGLIEYRPRWQGRRLGRLAVLGTLEALEEVLRETNARHLVIADPQVRGDALRWARAVCRHHGVHVHRYVEKLVAYDGRVTIQAGPRDLTAVRLAREEAEQCS
jgi:UDP-GlcNAc:undecaprenyl-phosphate GlcNAc-1-phosphate transferase